ncbi:MAG: PhnD/SsuA/transferrin family substrate-binding protein [Rhodobacter sp.]|nr:PhnD/SsuA/transferrin family substrate-binding protein [Rhodobacter sp.]
MIASLPMYDRPETVAANDRLWAGIRDRLHAEGLPAPEALIHGAPDLWAQWTSPDLVLSQTCGLPYRSRLHGQVTLVGTPDYAVDGCGPGHYRSVFVARADDPRDRIDMFDGAGLAYNDALSQSGWAAPQTHAAQIGIRLFAALQTGAHAQSARAVAGGRAEIAALDAVTWRLLQRFDPVTRDLRVVGLTEPTPGLPLITAPGHDADILFDVLAEAIADMPGTDRDLTGLRRIVRIPAAAYLAVPTPPSPDRTAQETCGVSP